MHPCILAKAETLRHTRLQTCSFCSVGSSQLDGTGVEGWVICRRESKLPTSQASALPPLLASVPDTRGHHPTTSRGSQTGRRFTAALVSRSTKPTRPSCSTRLGPWGQGHVLRTGVRGAEQSERQKPQTPRHSFAVLGPMRKVGIADGRCCYRRRAAPCKVHSTRPPVRSAPAP